MLLLVSIVLRVQQQEDDMGFFELVNEIENENDENDEFPENEEDDDEVMPDDLEEEEEEDSSDDNLDIGEDTDSQK